MTLELKKRILSITAGTLILGNFASLGIENPQNNRFYSSQPVYAIDAYEATIALEEYKVAYETKNSAEIELRLRDIDLNKVQVEKIRAYLEKRGAPLSAHAETFVRMAKKYDLPYNLMPAISIIESSGGKYNYRPYNYAGMGGQGNAKSFANYDEAIEFHATFLRAGYFDKGADTPEEIEKYYCYQCPTWGEKVQGVMNAIDSM